MLSYSWGMVRDSTATAARILEAAVGEFSRYGLAGARVERIAAAAPANIRMIYSHYGSKEGLFEAALDHALTELSETVPVDETDLPEWTGRVFDYHRRVPAAYRLSLWRELERPALGPESADMYAAKLAAIRAATDDQEIAPLDLLVLLFGMAQSWLTTPQVLRQVEGDDPEARTEAHRVALVAAARAICAAQDGPPRAV
jgi:AcrR family transcriptional regulator